MLADGSTGAPARRVGFFPNYAGPLDLNSDGWSLFGAAVEWLLDDPLHH